MSSNKVTYLLGAGASFNTLPVVSDFNKRLSDFTKEIIPLIENSPVGIQFKPKTSKFHFSHYAKDLNIDLNDLIKNISKHQSIDTYAKKLSALGDDSKLETLKKLLTIFFIYEQYKKPPDIRYDSFIASMYDINLKKFPDHVNVITWNYDIQFELALCNFLNLGNLQHAQDQLNVICNNEGKSNCFTVYKINGTANLVYENGKIDYPFNGFLSSDFESMLPEEIIGVYNIPPKFFGGQSAGINYSWETFDSENATWKKASTNSKDTPVLVVIGYSFPFFNRSIDQAIIRNMNPSKVYIQDKEGKPINNVIQSFKSIGLSADVKIEPIAETSQFFLPPELSL